MKTAILAAAFIVATGALASPGAHGPNGEHLEAKAVAASNALARLPDERAGRLRDAQVKREQAG